jgi:acyl-CoA thioesterase
LVLSQISWSHRRPWLRPPRVVCAFCKFATLPVVTDSSTTTADDHDQAEFTRDLGIEILGLVDEAFVVALDLDARHMSRANRAHGGLLFTLLDTAMGRALLEHLPEGRGCATVEIKINYFRPIQSGRIEARGWMRELTRSLGYSEGEVVNEEGKVLARASGTFFLTESLRQADRERI